MSRMSVLPPAAAQCPEPCPPPPWALRPLLLLRQRAGAMPPPFKKGEALMVTHTDGREYAAKVIDVGKRGVKVHYMGWKKSW